MKSFSDKTLKPEKIEHFLETSKNILNFCFFEKYFKSLSLISKCSQLRKSTINFSYDSNVVYISCIIQPTSCQISAFIHSK